MDPVSHVLFGHAVAVASRRERLPPGIHAALVIGSVFPDVDAALALRGFDAYLLAHASGTHSAVGSLVGAGVLSALLRVALGRPRWLPLFLASWVGIAGHIFWDLADGSETLLLKPFSNTSFGWHLVAMAEPIVLVVLIVAAAAAWRSTKGQRAAVTALAALALVLAGKSLSQRQALAVYQQSAGAAAPDAVRVTPQFGRLFTWTITDRVFTSRASGTEVRAWNVDGRTGRVEPVFAYRDAAADPLAVASARLPVVRTFLGLARMPFARIEAGRSGAEQLVLWSDAANCSRHGCDVSFGGAFERGDPAYQVIRIGSLAFKRPASADAR